MAVVSKALFRGAATTTNATLYTTPSTVSTVVTNIIVTNTDASSATYTLGFDGVALADAVSIPAKGITAIDLKQVLAGTETVTGSASTTGVNFHISGVEIA
jgi:hypothetical protein